ncbi:MAG: hypothetical protein WA880_15870, partial [Ornithinimicrobium sp.]
MLGRCALDGPRRDVLADLREVDFGAALLGEPEPLARDRVGLVTVEATLAPYARFTPDSRVT